MMKFFLSCLLILFTSEGLCFAQGQSPPAGESQKTNVTKKQVAKVETWWQRILRYAGLTATPTRQRGPGNQVSSGDVWVYDIEQRSSRPLTSGGGYISPIFIERDEMILALKGEDIIQIPVRGGNTRVLGKRSTIIRFIGINLDSSESILALAEANNVLSITSVSLKDLSRETIPYETESEEGRRYFAQLVGWQRVYCNTEIYVEEQCTKDDTGNCVKDRTGQIKWFDVMFKRAYKSPINISKCERDNCGQPSLSQDGQSITYLRSPTKQ